MDLLDEAMQKHDSFQIPQIKHKIRKAHQIIREVIKRMRMVYEKTAKKASRKRGAKKQAILVGSVFWKRIGRSNGGLGTIGHCQHQY